MITHLAMNSHPNPEKVLVIGGGDGGVLREVIKHPSVKTAILCDIDEAVIRLSKKYLPAMSIGFLHPSVSIHIGDGFQFLRDCEKDFDVIITDSSDPKGPAETLFRKEYFELMKGALRKGGVIATQGHFAHLYSCHILISALVCTHFSGSAADASVLSRKPVASSSPDHQAAQVLPRALLAGRIRLHYHSHLPVGSDRFLALLR